MRANYKIPADLRCPRCKGWGTVLRPGAESPSYNHGLPLGADDYQDCANCGGTGRKYGGMSLEARVARLEAHAGFFGV